MPQPAPGHANNHRNAGAPAVANLSGVVDELIEPGGDKIVELDFSDGPLTRKGRPDTDAQDAGFRNRRVDQAVAEVAEKRAKEQKRVPILPAHILAVDKNARIGGQRIANAEHDAVEKRPAFRI